MPSSSPLDLPVLDFGVCPAWLDWLFKVEGGGASCQEGNSMLILRRKVGQSVSIGPDVRVTVVDVRGDSIRLGIDAPRDIDVHREEVLEQYRCLADLAAPEGQR